MAGKAIPYILRKCFANVVNLVVKIVRDITFDIRLQPSIQICVKEYIWAIPTQELFIKREELEASSVVVWSLDVWIFLIKQDLDEYFFAGFTKSILGRDERTFEWWRIRIISDAKSNDAVTNPQVIEID
jgi:hypothetical protein